LRYVTVVATLKKGKKTRKLVCSLTEIALMGYVVFKGYKKSQIFIWLFF